MDNLLSGLNPAQREAVTTTDGPVLILAGAGSGKTRTLTARLAYLIQEKKIDPGRLLAVTFTNKAAGEMAARVAKLLSRSGTVVLPWLGTFHRISAQILRRELNASRLPYTSSFTIYDSADQLALVRQVMKERQIDPKQYHPKAIKAFIEGAKNELLSPAAYARIADGHFQEIVARVYQEYQARLVATNVLDFDDLIMVTLQLFELEPAVLQKYQRRFKYLLVDEYQDTNKGQYSLVRQLAAVSRNLFVVGDDWQAIYAFRGADFRNILNFERDYPEAKVIKLEENYRSSQNILDAAHEVITKNRRRSDKKLFTQAPAGDPIKIVECLNDLAEGEFIVRESGNLVKREQETAANLNEIVVLYRTNAQSRALEEVLVKAGVPYRIVGALRFYERREVKDLLAYLRLLVNPADRVSFERVVNVPSRKIGAKTLAQYWAAVGKSSFAGHDAWPATDDKGAIPPKIAQFLDLLGSLRRKCVDQAPAEIVSLVAAGTNYEQYLRDGTEEGESRWENILELKSAASRHESLDDFLAQVALVQDTDQVKGPAGPEKTGALTLMTLHAVKGLEFGVVFIVGLEESLLPHQRALLEPAEMEEERRLAYVGMTRPKKRLYLVYATERRHFGGVVANPPSRFIDEIPEHLKEIIEY